jgi:hypothetical protein
MDPDPIRIWTLLFSALTFRLQDANKKKIKFLEKFFCLLLFEGIFTLFFKDKKSKRRHETIGIKVGSGAGPDPDPYL